MRQRLPRSPGPSHPRLLQRLCSPQRAPHRWLQHLYQLKKAFSAGSRTCLAPSLSRRLSLHWSRRLKRKSALAKPDAMAVASVVSSVVNAANSAASGVVMVDAVAVAALRVAPKDVQKAARKVVPKARVVPKDVQKVALKAVAANAASAILKAAAKPVVKSARNAQPVKRETTAIQKAAPKTANRAAKAAVADATAAMAVTVASALRVTRSSKTSQPPIRRRWLRPWAATRPSHRRVAQTERPLRPARTRVTAHRVSARKATVKRAVSAAVAAMTVVANVVKGQMVRTPHLTQ